MRSASSIGLGLAVCLVAGCTTTQQKAAWLRLNGARLRATELPTRITQRASDVRVAGVSVARQAGETALIVTIENLGPRPVSDLPVLAGYRVGGRRPVYLNSAAGLDYFQSHLPAIAAHGSLRWVLAGTRRLPRGARPVAEVGSAAAVASAPAHGLPRIVVRQLGPLVGGRLRVQVINASPVPQYQLQLYAVASRGRRLVAAGHVAIEQLGSRAAQELTVRLIGSRTSRPVAVQAPPTIFS